MAEGGDEWHVELVPCGHPLPLNLKRLTAAHVQQLARTLQLPTTASLDDIRQMIDGKLAEMGHEPLNVQVVMQRETEGGRVYLYLQDAVGVFLESAPEPEPLSHGTEKETETDEKESYETSEMKTLKDALNEAEERNAALAREVSSLRGIQKQQDRVKELWKFNCEQLAMHEHALGGRSLSTVGGRPIDPSGSVKSLARSLAWQY